MGKYKKGDLVKIQHRPNYSKFKLGAHREYNGQFGIIIRHDRNDDTYLVRFDDNQEYWFTPQEVTISGEHQTEKVKPRFKVGDPVTFKSKAQLGRYYFGGDDLGGVKGEITRIDDWRSDHNCFEIRVRYQIEGGQTNTYSMLESEMVEYDQIVSDLPSIPKSKKTSLNFNY